MKKFEEFIIEEWLGDGRKDIPVFKNPTPKEMSELLNACVSNSPYPHGYGGGVITKSGDVYVFGNELHQEIENKYKVRSGLYYFRFKTNGRKMQELGTNLHYITQDMNRTAKGRADIVKYFYDVYTNKRLSKYMDSFDNVMAAVKEDFFDDMGYEDEWDDIVKRLKR